MSVLLLCAHIYIVAEVQIEFFLCICTKEEMALPLKTLEEQCCVIFEEKQR